MAENDIALIDALHVNPRANFENLAPALGVAPVTISRRWRNLFENGEAWISSAPGARLPLSGAVVWCGCEPACVDSVAARLASLAHVASVHATSGAQALYALVVTNDPDAMTSLLMDVLYQIPGVISVEAALALDLYAGRTWDLGALDAGQRRALQPSATRRLSGSGEPLDEDQRRLYIALQRDGRASYRELSQQLGDISEQTVKRRLEALVRDDRISLRTDFVRPAAGWPAQIALRLLVPDGDLDEVGAALGGWPETRVCASVLAPANLFVTLQLHELGAITAVLSRIAHQWPNVEVVDRRAVLRPIKSWGRLLGGDGRATGFVPVDLWAAPGT